MAPRHASAPTKPDAAAAFNGTGTLGGAPLPGEPAAPAGLISAVTARRRATVVKQMEGEREAPPSWNRLRERTVRNDEATLRLMAIAAERAQRRVGPAAEQVAERNDDGAERSDLQFVQGYSPRR